MEAKGAEEKQQEEGPVGEGRRLRLPSAPSPGSSRLPEEEGGIPPCARLLLACSCDALVFFRAMYMLSSCTSCRFLSLRICIDEGRGRRGRGSEVSSEALDRGRSSGEFNKTQKTRINQKRRGLSIQGPSGSHGAATLGGIPSVRASRSKSLISLRRMQQGAEMSQVRPRWKTLSVLYGNLPSGGDESPPLEQRGPTLGRALTSCSPA